MNDKLEAMLNEAGIDSSELQRLVDLSLAEDLRFGPDVTSEATIPADQSAEGEVVARQTGIVCGVEVALAVLEAVQFPLSGVTIIHQDGDTVHADVRGAEAAGMRAVQLDPYDLHADFGHARLATVAALADLLGA